MKRAGILILSMALLTGLNVKANTLTGAKKKEKTETTKKVQYEYASFQYYYVIDPALNEMAAGEGVELEAFKAEQQKKQRDNRTNGHIIFDYGQFQRGDYEYIRKQTENQNNPIKVLNFLADQGWALDQLNSTITGNLIIYMYVVKRPKGEK